MFLTKYYHKGSCASIGGLFTISWVIIKIQFRHKFGIPGLHESAPEYTPTSGTNKFCTGCPNRSRYHPVQREYMVVLCEEGYMARPWGILTCQPSMYPVSFRNVEFIGGGWLGWQMESTPLRWAARNYLLLAWILISKWQACIRYLLRWCFAREKQKDVHYNAMGKTGYKIPR